jgi:hypothetical protein
VRVRVVAAVKLMGSQQLQGEKVIVCVAVRLVDRN